MEKEIKRIHSRCMIRLLKLDLMIRNRTCKNAEVAAKALAIRPRTVMRDIDLLRDQMGAPLKYEKQQGWIYTEPTFRLPAIQLLEGELIAVFLAEKLMQQYANTPYKNLINQAFNKIIIALPDAITINFDELSEAISFEIGPISELDTKIFSAINEAIHKRKRVEISYHTFSRDAHTKRKIDPYHLHNDRGEWHVIAFDHYREQRRIFHLSRIEELAVTVEDFQIPPDFNLAAYIAECFSMIRGEEKYEIEIEFDNYQAKWIRERKAWHASEQREELSDGRLLLRMKLGGLDAVKRFVMQYGAHAKVLKPPALVEAIRAEIAAMTKNYQH